MFMSKVRMVLQLGINIEQMPHNLIYNHEIYLKLSYFQMLIILLRV